MVEPAWAVAEIATSGSKREIVRRCLVNMVRLHHCWKRVMCALLIMSSEQIVWRLQSHADVKRTGTPLYQRNSRGPNAAPAKVHSTIVPPYQTATNGSESSVQCSAYAIALTPPAMRPATAPARTRLVGAALRTAKMVTAKGTMAMIGIERRHS